MSSFLNKENNKNLLDSESELESAFDEEIKFLGKKIKLTCKIESQKKSKKEVPKKESMVTSSDSDKEKVNYDDDDELLTKTYNIQKKV